MSIMILSSTISLWNRSNIPYMYCQFCNAIIALAVSKIFIASRKFLKNVKLRRISLGERLSKKSTYSVVLLDMFLKVITKLLSWKMSRLFSSGTAEVVYSRLPDGSGESFHTSNRHNINRLKTSHASAISVEGKPSLTEDHPFCPNETAFKWLGIGILVLPWPPTMTLFFIQWFLLILVHFKPSKVVKNCEFEAKIWKKYGTEYIFLVWSCEIQKLITDFFLTLNCHFLPISKCDMRLIMM